MCHILLAMPVIGLLTFVFFPFPLALWLYIPIALISLGLFYLIYRSMKRPVSVGLEGLVGGTGKVISSLERVNNIQYLVLYKGESWIAKCQDRLSPGDKVKVVSLDGIKLLVEGTGPGQQDKQSDCG